MGDIAGAGAVSKAVANVINHAADKIENACGWLATPKGVSKDKLIAKETFIHDLQNNPNLTPLQKAAFISESKKIIRQYKNQNDIYHLAMEQLSDNAKPDKVDEDWISQFFDAAKHVSQDEVKIIWGKLLANECENPGTNPRLLIHTLLCMDTKLAKSFNILCNCSVEIPAKNERGLKCGYPVSIIDWRDNIEFYQKLDLSYYQINELQSRGLIKYGNGEFSFGKKQLTICYFGNYYSLESNSEIVTGQVLFTDLGESLFRILQKEKVPGFFELCQDYFNRKNCKIRKLDCSLDGVNP